MGPEPAESIHDGVVEAGFLLSLAQALLVGLEVSEPERVSGTKAVVHQLVAGLEEHFNALAGAQFEVMLALGADVQVGGQIGFPDGLAAAHAFDPEALGADRVLAIAVGVGARPARGRVIAVFSLEPGHSQKSLYGRGRDRCQRGSGVGPDRKSRLT